MTPRAFKALARAVLDAHGLSDWKFKFDRHSRKFGRCYYGRKLITVSKPLALLNSDAEAIDTLLHEVAHALTSNDKDHGPEWQAKCVEIGAKPEAFYCASAVQRPTGRWRAVCPCCGREFRKFRRPKRRRYCLNCGLILGTLMFEKQ